MEKLGTVSIITNGDITIHSFQSPEEGEMTCSQIIETPESITVIDVLLLRPYAKQLRAYVDGLNKPVERVIVTHTHPDHWFGLEYFQDLPIYALQETIDEIEAVADQYIEYNHTVFGDKSTSTKVIPTNILTEGCETLGGVEFSFTKVTHAEANVMLMVEIPSLKLLVAQDLLYNGVYLYVGEKSPEGATCFDGWITTIKKLKAKNYKTILVGHGFNKDNTIFDEMTEYLTYAKTQFEAGIKADDFKAKMVKRYPDYQVPRMLDVSNIFLYNQF